ncbi:tetratricopeptide repeat protein [Roseobacter sp. N2S]|uniref:tetratricopeptide repeat protein n=1 Tax=Roseobacter sp. N2S TaxID=2663844 RepID=UPI00285C2411|nr:tetratricopeptide repeat protein [Roseobacter sp. N2S]MDR6267666.1 tetratricopeptide (TPR) repeat protein [Roseobacter sp. N2S]
MSLKKLATLAVSLLFLSLLTACDSAEERAQKHFLQGLELIEQGDADRGLVELRNVFKLNGAHREARLLYAKTVYKQGKFAEAYGQYLRHVEFYPNDVEGRIALSEMALKSMNWGEVERHSKVALEFAPTDPRVRVVVNGLDFRNALLSKDKQAEQAAIDEAIILKDVAPESLNPRRVILEGFLRAGDTRAALKEVDDALLLHADEINLHQIKLSLFNQLGDTDALEKQLVKMIDLFPENTDIRATLLRWYMSRNEMEKAEAFLRTYAEAEGETGKADLIRFLVTTQGTDIALAEVERIIASEENNGFYRALRASLNFDSGKTDTAIAELEDLLASAEASDETRRIKVTLARIRWSVGNLVGARELVEEVLVEDNTQIDAMKLKAGWLIDGDQTNDAILLLRTALAQSPQDAQLMTLMARAYERDGSKDLVGEMLSLAVETSNNAPQESLLYARFLLADDKSLPAEGVLISALRLAPNNLEILEVLGNIYIKINDIARATQVSETLARLPSENAKSIATNLKLRLLQAQDHGDEVIRFLEGLAQTGEDDQGVRLAIIRTHVLNNKPAEALSKINESLQKYPDSPVFRALKARLLETTGDADQAIEIYRDLLQQDDQQETIWRELYAVLQRSNKPDQAKLALEQGMTALPDSATLKWMKASSLEAAGEVPAAIAIYEQLYALNSSNLVIANNLASLMANYTDEPEALERAYVIAKRLRGTNEPYFQDTYGWIAYRRGDYEEALSHLEPAADGRLKDPTVNYHLGMLYIALNRPEDAIEQMQKTLELARVPDPRPEIAAAKVELARLTSGSSGN